MQVVLIFSDLLHVVESLNLFIELLGKSSLLLLDELLEREVVRSLSLRHVLSDHGQINLSFIDSHRHSDFPLYVLAQRMIRGNVALNLLSLLIKDETLENTLPRDIGLGALLFKDLGKVLNLRINLLESNLVEILNKQS